MKPCTAQLHYEHALSAAAGVPLAREPMVSLEGANTSLQGRLNIDIEGSLKLLGPHVLPEYVGSMGVRVVEEIDGEGGRNPAGELRGPEVIDGFLHTPVIMLKVDPKKPDERSLNLLWLHELGHVGQQCRNLLYSERNIRIARAGLAAGAIATAAYTYKNNGTLSPLITTQLTVGAGLAYFSTLDRCKDLVFDTLWKWDRNERDAERFARKNKNQKLVTIS